MSTKFSAGNVFFWVFLVGASSGAFGAGFWYTYGATANITTKSPGQDKPAAVKTISHVPPAKVAAAATPVPGPIDIPSLAPTTAPVAAVAPADPGDIAVPAFAEPATPKPAVATPEAPGPEIFRVQVGPFDDRETADRQVSELQGAGINAVVIYDQGRYHAQLGAFSDRARAISVADEVNQRGYSVTIRH